LLTLPINIILMIVAYGAVHTAVSSGVDFGNNPWALYSSLFSSPAVIILYAILCLWNLVRFIPDLSLTARRLRDAGVTPWWIAISFATAFGSLLVPIFAFLCLGCCIIMLILLCKPSVKDFDSNHTTDTETTTK
ncbi:MAG: DUF805 domain-containing protein, partial [Bacteroidales bacterium]|nr:DUF805 domain-containing protein [Bacteroidales bacterium]